MVLFNSKDLNTGWKFRRTDDSDPNAWLPVAKVPTVVHLDLMANNKIPDTSCDMNERAAHWVGEKCWTYQCDFIYSMNPNAGTRVALVFEGLDTFATVRLNDKIILESSNMFIAHRVDITKFVLSGTPNVLRIDFESAVVKGRTIQKADNEHRYLALLGGPERLAVRKAQCHWGWDWGPAFLTAGPWRPIRLEVYQNRIEDISIQYTLEACSKKCHGTISAQVDGQPGNKLNVMIRNPEGDIIFQDTCDVGIEMSIHVPFQLKNLALWYPRGYGNQSLYTVEAELLTGKVATHKVTKEIGFREVQLIQKPDEYGKSFYFQVNGIDVFAGGACWIPADSFIPRLTKSKYEGWLRMMVEGNQVMVRVWGGGIYEEDIFYDLCDKLGILVWQDFMFACGSYPANKAFLSSVEAEARYNVRRLRHHPSVIMYAGGNENYFIQQLYSLTYNYDGDKDPESWLKSSFPSRYIFEHLLPKVVEEEASSTIYHPDSPWGDGKSIADQTVGDIHQWEIWHGRMRPYQEYDLVGGRFVSEFGMEAFPHLSTIRKFVSKVEEQRPQSATMDFHNKSGNHTGRLAFYVREGFEASNSGLENWVYLTQVLQSEALRFAYRSWRRRWGCPGARRCGGALVWQLNDCWPATSWAIVDFYLVKKPAFYTIQRALSPVSVTVQRNFDNWMKGHWSPSSWSEYDVWITTDGSMGSTNKLKSSKGAVEVELRFISIRTGQYVLPTKRHKINTVHLNGTTTVCERVRIDSFPSQDAFVISAKILVGGVTIQQDTDWPQPYKYLSFSEDRGIQVQLMESRTKLKVTAMRPTKALVFSEREGLRFSDNGLDVMPGDEYVIDVEGLREDEQLTWMYLGMMDGSPALPHRAQL